MKRLNYKTIKYKDSVKLNYAYHNIRLDDVDLHLVAQDIVDIMAIRYYKDFSISTDKKYIEAKAEMFTSIFLHYIEELMNKIKIAKAYKRDLIFTSDKDFYTDENSDIYILNKEVISLAKKELNKDIERIEISYKESFPDDKVCFVLKLDSKNYIKQ